MNSLHLFKGRHLSKYFEKYYPLGATLLTASLLYYIPQAWLTLSFCKNLASSYATIFSICFGFAFASVSTLLGLSDKPFIRGMRESGALAGLISYHWSCVRWCSLGTALGAAAGLLPPEWYQAWQGMLFIAVGIGALLSTWRIVRFFAKVIKYTGF